MEITLVRHTSVGVPKGTCYGWSDVPVADTFEAEASETLRQLEAIVGQHGQFDTVYSSPLTRARLLAGYCGFPQPIVDERLKEMYMGAWEMRRFEDIERDDPHILQWYDDYLHEPTTGGESFPLFYRRVASFFSDLAAQPSRRVLVFAHGGVLACAAIYAGRYKPEEAFRHLTPYGGIISVSIPQRTVRKATVADVPAILQMCDESRAVMRQNGNMHQWTNGYPTEAVIRRDIEGGHSYVIEEGGMPVGTFAFIPSPEPTYANIYEGEWMEAERPYYVVHRIASKADKRGVMRDLLDYCFRQTDNIRIDTHRDNSIMQHLLGKHGFAYCGIIYLADGDERLAYQKIRS